METPIQQEFELTKHSSADSFITLPPTADQIATVSYSFMPQIKSASLKTEAYHSSIKIAQTLGIPSLILSGGLKTGYSNVRSNFIYDTSYQLTTIGYVRGDVSQPVTANVPITTATKQTQNLSDQFKNNFGQYVTLTLSVPIFNRYQARNSIAIARVNVRTALLNEQLTKNDLRKKIETVYINQITAGLKMMAIKEQLAIEQATYTDMEKKYGFGAVGATDFLIEKNNFNKATMSFIQAKYDYAFKSKMIDFYLNKPLNY
jgi:outer membrane protein